MSDEQHRAAIRRRRQEEWKRPTPCVRCRNDHTGGTMFCADCKDKCATCDQPRVSPAAYCGDCQQVNRLRNHAARRTAMRPDSPLCRCGACGRQFRNLGAFDAHRPDRNGCGDPTAVGLVEQDGLWATPEGHAAADESRRRLKAARPAPSPGAQTRPTAGPASPQGGHE